MGTSVKEYIIHQNLSSFRHWVDTASSDNLTQSSIRITPCFTEATFSTAAIAGWPINIRGENKFIWAMHNDTYFKVCGIYIMSTLFIVVVVVSIVVVVVAVVVVV